ncbi:DUF305 domain-containing protein [Agromyces lapidis]|nr:DUF305 domain-containing protein [Agromyces lapidis]
MHRAVGLMAVVIATSAALAGCTINIDSPDDDRDRRSGMMSDADTAGYDPADLMFARMMIPHHQQAVDMSELAIETSADAEVLALAEQIRDAQTAEIAIMEGWLDDAGVRMPMGDGLDMGDRMGMGGMLSDEEMRALEDASAAEFDQLYLEGMIEHHEGALLMARMILNSDNPDVRALGEAIVESQTAEIELMKQMLDE